MKKLIHRIFFNFDDTVDPFLPYLDTWRRELPDFEIKLWDKSNLPLDLNAYTKYMTATKNHAFLSDYFRCWLLVNEGGAYLDADIEVLDGGIFRKIYEETQLAQDFTLFIGIESARNGELTPHSMGVKCGETHDMLHYLMNLYETVFTTSMRYVIQHFTMPDLIVLYFMEHEENKQYSLSRKGHFYGYSAPLVTKNMKIYPQDYFSPVTTYNNEMMISAFSNNTCLCHHFAATWKKEKKMPGALFATLLKENGYVIAPELVSAVKDRYELPVVPRKPAWALNSSEIAALERVLNRCIPYGGKLYSMLRKLRKG
ncbi:MAG: hypothetical protein LBQ88_03070 [Treponema sp.]|jgi:hypothetical protein|nr:hypothetical protein [Treponema sp.]